MVQINTIELPVDIRKTIYSSSLDIFLKEVSASVAKRLNYSSRGKKNRKFPDVATSLQVRSDVWVMTDEALECKSRSARPICLAEIRSLGNYNNFSSCKERQ